MDRGSLTEIKQNMEVKDQPLITVAVTVYNIKDYLQRSIGSVCNQTYSNLEILLVDDGSTDTSYNILKKYEEKDDRITVVHIQHNMNQYFQVFYYLNVQILNIQHRYQQVLEYS